MPAKFEVHSFECIGSRQWLSVTTQNRWTQVRGPEHSRRQSLIKKFKKSMAFTEHVDDVINSCARSMYAISVLRSHVRTTSSAGLSVSRHLKAHLRCSSVVGLFDVC